MSTEWGRRQFISTALASTAAFVAAGCSSSHAKTKAKARRSFAPTGNFGGRIDAGPIDDVRRHLAGTAKPFYVPEARCYVLDFPAHLVEPARGAYPKDALPMLEAGLVVLYQRCTHLGCRVPWCATSEWFECPCHAARFDQIGEKRDGPAPRGMDLVPSSVKDGRLVIDTARILPGLPIGTNIADLQPAGPFCVNSF